MRQIALLLTFSLLLGACTQKNGGVPPLAVTPIVESYPVVFEQQVRVPGKPVATESAKAKQDENALSVLTRTHNVQTKHFSFGDVAESIDGNRGGTDGRYWIFYVNGKMSEIGAGEYKVKNGDVVIWKLQKEGESL